VTETRLALAKSGSAVFDSSGTATVVIRNTSQNRWVVTNTAVSTTSGKTTSCTVYEGSPNVTNQRDFTKVGNGRASNTEYNLLFNNFLTAVWTGGDIGSIATITINGDEFTKGMIY
jgi:hypothetical protein